jgi:hypothetical protein
MMIVISDACTINVSRSVINNSWSINYKNIMIVNDKSRVVRMTPQLVASLTDNSKSVIYDRTVFIIQAIQNLLRS